MKASVRIVMALTVAIFCMSLAPQTAHAIFDKNRIIDDIIFNNTGTMSAGDIDAFLNARNSCISPNSGFRAIDPIGYSPSTGYQYGGNVTAGTVIAHAAQAYDLNPQVLLVTLQKEQSLITTTPTHSNCNTRTISKAMGYACTDSYTPNSYSGINLYSRHGVTYTSVDLTCVESIHKAGFTQQMIRAAWLLKFSQQRSLGNIGWAIIRGSWDNSDDLQSCYSGPVTQGWRQVCPSGPTTYYDGYTTIDGQSVHPESGATVALYRYTPHFHGNENFITIWNSWFGSTHGVYAKLDTPRWMSISHDTYKKDIVTGSNDAVIIPQGTQLKFVDKILLNGKWYLRTEYDSAHNLHKGVFPADVVDVPYTSMATPRWMQLNRNAYKQIPSAGKNVDSLLDERAQLFFTSQITINNQLFLRSSYDATAGLNKGIPFSFLDEISYVPFEEPRWMQIKNVTEKLNPVTNTPSGITLTKGSHVRFTSKIYVNGSLYFRTASDTTNNIANAVKASDIEPIEYTVFKPNAYCMQLKNNSHKVVPHMGQTLTNEPLAQGGHICLSKQITVNGITYYQSHYDAQYGLNKAIPANDLEEIPYQAITPTPISLKTNATKQDPKTGLAVDGQFNANTSLTFSSKINVNGVWYYRTAFDTQAGLDKAFAASALTSAP